MIVVLQNSNTELCVCDISQAYNQSTTKLNQNFFIQPSPEINLESNSILNFLKQLYSVPEVGNHWLKTYHSYHTNRLAMAQ